MSAGKSGVWILYIWIFILFWKAACLQGERHVNKRIKRAAGDYDLSQGATQRKLKASGQHVGYQNEKARSFENIIEDSTKFLKASNKKPSLLVQALLETTEENIEKSDFQTPYVSFPNENQGVTAIQNDDAQAVLVANVPPPLDAKTNPLIDSHVPPPLETHIVGTKDEQANQFPEKKNKASIEYDTTPALKGPKGKGSKRNNSVAKIVVADVSGTSTSSDSGLKDLNPDPAKMSKNQKKDPSFSTTPNMEEIHLSTNDMKDSNTIFDSTSTDDNSQTYDTKSTKAQVTTESRKKTNKADKRVVNKPLKLVTYTQFVGDKMADVDNMNSSEVGDKIKSLMKTKQRQSLLFLQNATKQAEALQQTLKSHKLKLKSYMEVLKNLTLEHAEDKKKMNEYTQSVRNKVQDILNPKKKLDKNQTKPEKNAKDVKQPEHLLFKNITETLRARVNMADLKESEEFWDRKGEDIEDAYVLRFEHEVSTDDFVPTDEFSSDSIIADYMNPDSFEETDDISKVTNPVPHSTIESASHLTDIHKADLDDIRMARDRLTGRTKHEASLMSNIVSARIHGNILAPPPERCSVSANMIRYRPPETQMDKDDSLFYRVDLQPEIEKALEGGPMNYLPDYKNPCWLSKITDEHGSTWYDYTESGLTYKRMSFLYEMRLSKNSNWRMRCLPLLFFVGVTKSGTTDLYTRLMGHPEIMRPAHKEPMWWNRLTLGMAQSLRKPFRYYLDFFDEAAELMRRKVVMKNGKPYHPGITVDATPANLWDYDCWTDIPGNRGLAEPKYTLAHSLKKLIPNAKILMILRQPTDRLYSQYRMKSHREPSSTFHKQVQEALDNFNTCLEKRTLRSCAYDHDMSAHEFGSPGGVFLRASLYYVYLKDWLDVFPREQVMVVRTEDYHNNTGKTLEDIFDFLDLSPLSKERMTAISKQKDVNTRADHADRSLEPILPETQKLLDDFFRPYNKMLAKLLHDKRFKWNDIRQY